MLTRLEAGLDLCNLVQVRCHGEKVNHLLKLHAFVQMMHLCLFYHEHSLLSTPLADTAKTLLIL